MTLLSHRLLPLTAIVGISATMLMVSTSSAVAGYTALVSQTDYEAFPNGESLGYRADVSPDGRYVVFESNATNLACCVGSNTTAVYLRDTLAQATRVISTSSNSESYAIARDGHAPSVSDDGQRVAFISSTALVSEDTNNQPDVYVRTRGNNTIRLVSRNRYGDVLTTGATPAAPRISGDGKFVVFTADYKSMGFGNSTKNGVFRASLDTATIQTVLVSSIDKSTPANQNSSAPDISYTGSTVAFQSDATNLVPGKSKGIYTVSLANNTPVVYFETDGYKNPFATPEPSLNKYGTSLTFDGMWTDYEDWQKYNVATVLDRTLDQWIGGYMPGVGRTANADGMGINGRSAVLSSNGEFLLVTTRPIAEPYTLFNYQMIVVHLESEERITLTNKYTDTFASGYGIGISDDGLRVTFVSRGGNLLVSNGASLYNKGQIYQQILPPSWWTP